MTAVRRPSLTSRRAVLTALPLGLLGLAACTDNPSTTSSTGGSGTQAAGGPITVTITDDACTLSSATVPSGSVTFRITNKGTVPNEFEILAEDKLRIISEQENIGPGTSVHLTVGLPEGEYWTASKPNMVGDLVGDAKFTVTKGETVALDEDTKKLQDDAVKNYTAYIKDQTGQLVSATKEFTDAYVAGDTDKAKSLFSQARKYYERIEPTAEAFGIKEAGDLDGALDLRIQDIAADAKKSVTDPEVLKTWTGWHRIEADLYSKNKAFHFASEKERKAAADNLTENTQKLYDLVYGKITGAGGKKFAVTLQDVINGASALLNEVATGKIVGEEDTFSHTDLDDFQANLDGAKVAYGNVQQLVENADKDLAEKIDEQFDAVQKVLDKYKDGTSPDGDPKFVDYSTIAAVQKDAGKAPGDSDYTKEQREISTVVNALSESLSKVSGTIQK